MTVLSGAPSRVQRRRLVARALLRATASTVVLTALYFLAPLDRIDLPVAWLLAIGLLILLGGATWQVHRVTKASFPAVRAIEALAVTAPLFLLLFAAAYFVLARDDPASFGGQPLTRTDALYFTVTVFATVGFGDIAATSQTARLLVTVQMVLDLLVLGFGIRVFTDAVRRSRQR